jgi:hypothetical protein
MAELRSTLANAFRVGFFQVAQEEFNRGEDIWEDTLISGLGYAKIKPEFVAFSSDQRIQGPVKKWFHDTWGLKCEISQEAIEDDLYGVIKGAAKSLGLSMKMTRRYLPARMLMNITATTYHTAGDGYAICYTAHNRLDGSTYSNRASAGADLTEASLEDAIFNWEDIKDHRGKRTNYQAKKLLIGPKNEMRAKKILMSTGSTGADAAHSGVYNPFANRSIELIIEPEITDRRFFVMGEKRDNAGMIWFDRVKPTIATDVNKDVLSKIWYGRWRSSLEVNDPSPIYCVPEA